jgi:hypothetical protein
VVKGDAADASVAGSDAGGDDSLADCSWTLVKPFSAGDPASVSSAAELNIDVNDIARPDPD